MILQVVRKFSFITSFLQEIDKWCFSSVLIGHYSHHGVFTDLCVCVGVSYLLVQYTFLKL